MASPVNTIKYTNNSTLQKIDDDYYAGMYTSKIRRDVAREFRLAGLFPTNKVSEKQITVMDVWTGDEVEDQVKGRKKKLVAEGTSLRKVRARSVTPEGLKLEQYGIELDIELRDLKEKRITINEVMRPITKYLADEIDKTVYQAAVDAATDESTRYGLTNNWSTHEIEDIIGDIIKIRNNKLAESFDFQHIVCGMKALTELEMKSSLVGMEYVYPKTAKTLSDTVDLAGMHISWGGHTMDEKELIAFQADLPALEIFYLEYENPNVQKVPSIGQYEKFAPLINVLKYDNAKTEPEPILTFKFSTGVGCYAPEKGKRLMRVPNVMN